MSNLSIAIARARSGLVQELVEVFNVVEVGGRPPIGGKAGTKGEWTIGDLILPVPGDMRRELLSLSLISASFFNAFIRLPTRPHQRRSYAHGSFLVSADILSRNQTSLRSHLDWG